MSRLTLSRTVAFLLIFALTKCATGDDASRADLYFEQHVRPILKAHCFHCHGDEPELQGGLDLRLVRLMTQGGDSGAAILPSGAQDSLLWERIAADEMPEGTKKLDASQKDTIRRWLDQGARTRRAEPDDPDAVRFTLEELDHWAYQPVTQPIIPRVPGYTTANPIDAFLARRLDEQGLSFAEEADRATLIRRVTFDVTGLPPTPDEVEAFLDDDSPQAYERVVERLLASPQFGVRWGRHWLDVAGYAESNGGDLNDSKRPHIWRYRDYVINALNRGKPIDAFLTEQLAGDELVEDALDAFNDRQRELLTATGFLRLAPDATQTSNTLTDRNMAAADAIKVISSALLGVTIGCAQCHDHKYDPIGIDDYYRFRAIFDPVFPLQNWQQPSSLLVDFTTEDVKVAAQRIEDKAKTLEADLKTRRDALAQKIQELKLDDVPEQDREATRAAVLAEDRTDEQKRLLDLYPMVKPTSHIIGLLVEYDGPSYRKFEKEKEQIAALRDTKPAMRLVRTTRERPEVVPTSAIFFRGNPDSPKETVTPAELMVLRHNAKEAPLPENDEHRKTTGRRLAYARHLTDGEHPLTARVFVNRIWMHHFGRGLVATPGDFGIAGELPSHPELLDWLAGDFVRHRWDQKRLHRNILLSHAYRQRSQRTASQDAIDPENRLLARMNVRRLDAESIRDALLHVTKKLSNELGGPSIPVTENAEGKVVLGKRKIRDGLKAEVQGGADAGRRSIFIEVQRRLPLNMLATFDQPEMNPNCELRRNSTVATQSLWFLNDATIVERADELAGQLLTLSNDTIAIQELYLRLFATRPTSSDLQLCLEFIGTQYEHFRRHPDSSATAKRAAMASLCQTLLASNRFLYVD